MNKKGIYNTIIQSSNKNLFLNQEMKGFSLIELIFAMVLTLIILGVAVAAFSSALSSRARESSKTDAITSAQAALNIMSREIGNSGFGLTNNGLGIVASNGVMTTDCTNKRLHFRTNTSNNNYTTNEPGEDVTFFFDNASQSVVKYDKNTGLTSGIINRISNVTFEYYDYSGTTVTGPNNVPTANTGRVTILLEINLANIQGQPSGQKVKVVSDVTLRNSPYMLGQY